jgi:hypothetical protein
MTQLHIDVSVVQKHHILLAYCEYHRLDNIYCTQLPPFRYFSLISYISHHNGAESSFRWSKVRRRYQRKDAAHTRAM